MEKFYLERVGKIENNGIAIPIGEDVPENILSQLDLSVRELYEQRLIEIVTDYTGQVFICFSKKGGEKI